jgi:hypothetical protein
MSPSHACGMPSSGKLRSVVLARIGVSEEHIASITMTRIGELETTLAVTSNVPSKLRFVQEPHGVTAQKTAFFSHRRDNLKSYTALTGWAL